MKIRRQIAALIILVIGIILVLFSMRNNPTIVNHPHTEIRAALDIGSGSTNLIVAKVDTRTDKIITQLFEKSLPVPYQKQLEQSGNNTFDRAVMDDGIRVIKTLKEMADQYHAKKVVAVATAAFRQASNANEFAKEIQAKTGVEVRIINQDEEGILAFRGALAVTPVTPEHALVWDIGGGSMQLTSLSKEGTYVIEKGVTASIPFKNYVIENIEHKNLTTVSSPNPMTKDQMEAAVEYASSLSLQTNPVVLNKIRDPQTKVLAVGNLFNYGVKPVVGESIIKQTALSTEVMKLAGKTDEQIDQGSLSEVAVTNPLLVLGYMKGLGIHTMETVQVNNASGALTYPAYWQ